MPYIKLLIDLDGTLTDTNGDEFDDIKYGRNRKFDPQKIPLIEGAVDFVRQVKSLGHSVAIISDSHHAYVEPMAKEVFGVPCLSLVYKPSTGKLMGFLQKKFDFLNSTKAEDFLFIGDNKLDIQIARSLKIPSVFLDFSHNYASDKRNFHQKRALKINEGATYYCVSYQNILEVLKSPAMHRFVLEDKAGRQTAKFLNEKNRNHGYTMFRGLARQQKGGFCDKFGAIKRYNDFRNPKRSVEFVQEIAEDTSNYLREVVCAYPDKFSWDYITCVPDKKTTMPPKKMEDFLSAIDTPIPKAQIFTWASDIDGSIRDKKNRSDRLAFVNKFISVQKEHSLKDKNVIVIDDQYTTGGTAKALSEKLLNAGVQNVFFVCLFYLANDVLSERKCKECDEIAQIKYTKEDSRPFFTCISPEYGGTGCGNWMEWTT